MKIAWSPQAIQDLQAFVTRVAADDPRAATKVVERVFRTVERLARQEFDGPQQRLRSGKLVRSWPVSPLRIYYSRSVDRLEILRVYHQARRPIAT